MDDNTPRDLAGLVLERIHALGDEKAAEYFGVSPGTILNWRSRKINPSLAAAQKVWDSTLLCHAPEVWGKAENAHLQILLPIYGEVDAMNHITLFRNYRLYGVDKINIIPRLRTLVEEARNDLVQKFLATKSEWCLMIDSDMVLPCGSGSMLRGQGWNCPEPKGSRVAIERIMSHPKEYRIVGGLYRDRRTGVKAQCERAFRSPQENARLIGILDGKVQDDGLEENGWVATGFIRFHRSVFEEMAAEAKPGGILADIAPPVGREADPIGFFGRTSKWRGEDIAACRRAGLLGIKTYCDVGTICGHRGDKIY